MPSFRTGAVREILAERAGLQRLLVRLHGSDQRAYNLTALTGVVAVGDEVVCNTTAVDLGLGTGGWHVVHWNLANRSLELPGGGHIMKMRYTSLQADTGSAEEHRRDLPQRIEGVPVVACSLHSQLAAVAVAFADHAPGKRLVYVMSDGAALPMVLSDLVHDLVERGLLVGVVTAGHAFGGDHEAVNVISALCVAVHVMGADAVVVAMGPGVVGTGTTLGTTAHEVVGILADTAAIGGHPIVCVRASGADARTRHQGISHHTRTALTQVGPVTIAAPRESADLVGDLATATAGSHDVRLVDVGDVGARLSDAGLRITTMGRAPKDDALPFTFAAAAGVVAASLVRR